MKNGLEQAALTPLAPTPYSGSWLDHDNSWSLADAIIWEHGRGAKGVEMNTDGTDGNAAEV